MSNNYFKFKQFVVNQERAAFKVTTDSVLLGAWADLSGAGRILDIGTGTGLLALMAAQRSEAEITGIEPDIESFAQAEANIKENRWYSRIKIINISLQSYLNRTDERYDVIIANPPFFSGSLLNPDFRKAAARHTFTLGVSDLLEAAVILLKSDGRLQLILPSVEGERFLSDALRHGLHCNRMMCVRPSPSSDIKRVLLSLERKKSATVIEELVIETEGRHKYSEEYLALTRDFYLDK